MSQDVSSIDISSRVRGGISASEMGLGKTVEMLALVALHPFSNVVSRQYYTNEWKQIVDISIMSEATLIITPRSIMQQWCNEIDRHAPALRYTVYNGIKGGDSDQCADYVRYDIVLTTYEVLTNELHYTKPVSKRPRRYEQAYIPPKSPLTRIMWWRVCLDEAQMVRSKDSNPSRVAARIPGVHRWAVTGTPVRNRISDAAGLLTFLGVPPFRVSDGSHPLLIRTIDTLTSADAAPTTKQLLIETMRGVMYRNCKVNVRGELTIPRQHRWIVLVKLGAVEQMMYDDLWRSGYNTASNWINVYNNLTSAQSGNGNGDGNENSLQPSTNAFAATQQIYSWLLRLRQTCLHPQLGREAGRRLGSDVKSIESVLTTMIMQADDSVYTNEHRQLELRLERGMLYEAAEQQEKALEIYNAIEKITVKNVETRRTAYTEIKALAAAAAAAAAQAAAQAEDTEDSKQDKDELLIDEHRVAVFAHRVTSAITLLHQLYFLLGSVHHHLKHDESLESRYYAKADDLRHELLGQRIDRVNNLAKHLREGHAQLATKLGQVDSRAASNEEDGGKAGTVAAADGAAGGADGATDGAADAADGADTDTGKHPSPINILVKVPDCELTGGIVSNSLMQRSQDIRTRLSHQGELITEWRSIIRKCVLTPLYKSREEDADPEEYAEMQHLQEVANAYLDEYSKIIGDRYELLTGAQRALFASVPTAQPGQRRRQTQTQTQTQPQQPVQNGDVVNPELQEYVLNEAAAQGEPGSETEQQQQQQAVEASKDTVEVSEEERAVAELRELTKRLTINRLECVYPANEKSGTIAAAESDDEQSDEEGDDGDDEYGIKPRRKKAAKQKKTANGKSTNGEASNDDVAENAATEGSVTSEKRARSDSESDSDDKDDEDEDSEDDKDDGEALEARLATFRLPPTDLRGLIQRLKELLQSDKFVPSVEQHMITMEINQLNRLIRQQQDVQTLLEKEATDLLRISNYRIEYFRDLQVLSDTVTLPEVTAARALRQVETGVNEENTLKQQMVRLIGRRRYLEHLSKSVKQQQQQQQPGEERNVETKSAVNGNEPAASSASGASAGTSTASSAAPASTEVAASNNNDDDDDDEESTECLICKCPISSIALLTPCGHIFCESCLEHWLRISRRCPACSFTMPQDADIQRVAMSESAAEAHNTMLYKIESMKHLPRSSINEWTAIQNSAHVHSLPDSEIDSIVQTPLANADSFGSKLDSCIRHIKHIISTDAPISDAFLHADDPPEQRVKPSKIVVFSSWLLVLDILAKALAVNGIGYVRFGANATISKRRRQQQQRGEIIVDPVARFNIDPNVRVFLLHSQNQSAGLTLTAAQHVFICEPQLDPGVEKQVLGRVDRIGQVCETNIYYYVVLGSIEEHIFRLYANRRHDISMLRKQKIKNGEAVEDEDSDDDDDNNDIDGENEGDDTMLIASNGNIGDGGFGEMSMAALEVKMRTVGKGKGKGKGKVKRGSKESASAATRTVATTTTMADMSVLVRALLKTTRN
ncbi:hypothetical protein GQ42DRAFT_141708 [Ramicandelaber brevisporus]|nr:hypothetical protein GQ42DRAFT_141708 [Ramicandelaber brevisporus]